MRKYQSNNDWKSLACLLTTWALRLQKRAVSIGVVHATILQFCNTNLFYSGVFSGEEELFAFDRTVSRLTEMQTKDYWKKWKSYVENR